MARGAQYGGIGMMMLFEALLAAGGAGSGLAVDQVFSADTYTGTGASRTVTTGIDLTGAGTAPLLTGGVIWIKARTATTGHRIFDALRGFPTALDSSSTAALGAVQLAATSAGFALGTDAAVNAGAATYAAWTFRRAEKFFDVVTWTGDNATNRTIAHSLGSVPGMIIIKRTDSAGWSWFVHHRGYAQNFVLNTADGGAGSGAIGGDGTHTDTGFLIAPTASAAVNGSGGSFVAYLFAHDPGTDGVVQCGSYTGNGSATGPTVTLGWEPQFLLIKNAGGVGGWHMFDAVRGLSAAGTEPSLRANSADAETAVEYIAPTSTGFQIKTSSSEVNASGSSYIYLSIRKAT
jgi:hypothetical protein